MKMKIRLMKLIKSLGLLFALTMVLCHAPMAFAVKVAIVRSYDAIIYADQDQITPIGTVSYGKRINVSEKVKGRGTVFPLLVSGKIAYIRASDIYVFGDKVPESNKRYYDNQLLHQYVEEERRTRSYHLGFTYEKYYKGKGWDDLVLAENELPGSSMGDALNIYIQHLLYYWVGAKASWSFLSTKDGKISFLETGPELGFYLTYPLAINHHISADFTGSFHPFSSIKLTESRYSGRSYGLSFDANYSFEFATSWFFTTALGYRIKKYSSVIPSYHKSYESLRHWQKGVFYNAGLKFRY
ncbi:MAG: hypothetical protein HOE90_15750 [Bacteriovoracaceae bacterium]|nr:hypothetical protein [Bacteriovoracaceae bacterium]